MKRRLSLAMALVGNPNILFLDEPSSGILENYIKLKLILGLDPLSRK
jgi:ABC-type transporter Mla maintaining outer membrane lipid asymmetry ATPase subunit MlaF